MEEREANVGTLRVGIIGAGIIGQLCHLERFLAAKNCQVLALAELRPDLRRRVCERYGVPRGYATHEQMLADTEIDAIVVATRRPMTGPITLDCLRAGKHVLSEKPMAATVQQAVQLVSEAKSADSVYSIGYMRRHDEGIQWAKAKLDDLQKTGELGAITYVRAHCFQGEGWNNLGGHVVSNEEVPPDRPQWAIAPSWMPDDRAAEYAWFLNVHCHHVNLLRFLMGKTPTVDHVRLDHKNGRLAVLDFGEHLALLETGQMTHRGWDDVVEIYFEQGMLRIQIPSSFIRNTPAKVELLLGNDRHERQVPEFNWTWSYQNQADAFVSDALQRREPLASGADAVEDLRTIEQMWRLSLNIAQ